MNVGSHSIIHRLLLFSTTTVKETQELQILEGIWEGKRTRRFCPKERINRGARSYKRLAGALLLNTMKRTNACEQHWEVDFFH